MEVGPKPQNQRIVKVRKKGGWRKMKRQDGQKGFKGFMDNPVEKWSEELKEKVYKAKATEMFDQIMNFLNDLQEEGKVAPEDNLNKLNNPKHLVLVLEDLDNPDFLKWFIRKSENLIKEHKELVNSGVLVASFKEGELVNTRIMGIEEALKMIP